MSGVNNKNQRVVSIAGIMLCIFYVAFIAFIATIVTSIQWAYAGLGGEYEYISGWNSPDVDVVLFDTSIALLLVIPWIYYFLSKRKIDYKLGRGFAVFTILMIIFHFLFFMRIGDINTLCFGPKYIERDIDDDSLMLVISLFIPGVFFYIIVSIIKCLKIRKQLKNKLDNEIK